MPFFREIPVQVRDRSSLVADGFSSLADTFQAVAPILAPSPANTASAQLFWGFSRDTVALKTFPESKTPGKRNRMI